MSESTRRNYTVVTRTLERTKREPSAPPLPEEEVLLDPTTSANAGLVIGWRPDADETQPCYEAQPTYYKKSHRLEERANETKTETKDFHQDNDTKTLRMTEQKPQEMEQSSNLNEKIMKKVVSQHQVIKMPTPSKYYERSFPPELPDDKWASSQPMTMPEPVIHVKPMPTPVHSYMQPPSDYYPPVSQAKEKQTMTNERRSSVELVKQSPQVIQMPTPVKQFMRPPSTGFVSQYPQTSELRSSITQPQMMNMPAPVKYCKNESLMQPPPYSYPSGINERRSHVYMPTTVSYYKNESSMQPPSIAYPSKIPQVNDTQPGYFNTPTPVNCYKPSNSYPHEFSQTNDGSEIISTLIDRKWPVDRDHVWNHKEKSAIKKEPTSNHAEPPVYRKRLELRESKLPDVETRVTASTDQSYTNDSTGADECCTSVEVVNCICDCSRCGYYVVLILLFALVLVFFISSVRI